MSPCRALTQITMVPSHRLPLCSLAARSFLCDPLADVGWATPEFDPFGFGLRQEHYRLAVDQFYLCEFDSDDMASNERSPNNLQVFRGKPTADVEE